MDEFLSKLYFSPKTGFIGADKLYRKAKAIDSSITKQKVAEWYKSNHHTQQFSTKNETHQEFKIASSNPNEWQIDLAFWEKQPILIGVNINSRIGYAKLLKNKKSDSIQKAIYEFIKRHEVSAIMSDNGSEFINKKVETVFSDNSITHANSLVGDHTVLGKIDRFIRTIKARLTRMKDIIHFKKLTQNILNEAIDNYNTSYHSAIKAKPIQMKGKVMFDEIEHNEHLAKQVQKDFPKGSIVRYRLKSSKTFDKEGAKFSKTTYEVIGLDGLKMKLRSKNNNILFKPVNDLKLVSAEVSNAAEDEQFWEVEEILKHKKMRSGKHKYYVKWKGYDEPSWESQDNFRLINKNEMSKPEKDYWSSESK